MLVAVLVPVVLLGVLEFGLRGAGYGFDPAFLVADEDGRSYVDNPAFARQFFPPAVARMSDPIRIAAAKDPDTYRIFVVGGSAAMGTPEPSFGFARILEAMLRDRVPEAQVEIVNAAMVAINSHVVLPIVRDCVERDADLIIVYLGNNEVVGPFGPGTVFGDFTDDLTLLRAGLALRRTRTSQLFQSLLPARGAGGSLAEWKGMEFFLEHPVPADDPRLDGVYDHFRHNLRDMCRAAEEGGADVLLCTVGTNLRDCAPFASAHRADLTDDERRAWEEYYAAGVGRLGRQDFSGAIASLSAAATIDDRFAELRYRLGQAWLATGDRAAALEHLRAARDLDTLRFRADTEINRIVREVAGEESGAALVDIAEFLLDASEDARGLPGRDLFLEHCHPTFAGNHAIAAALYPRVLEGMRTQGVYPVPPHVERCAERIAGTPRARAGMWRATLKKLKHAPFVDQVDVGEQIDFARARIAALSATDPAEELRLHLQALEFAPHDPFLHRHLANLLVEQRDLAGAERHLRLALEAMPRDVEARIALAGVLVTAGKVGEGLEQYALAAEQPRCDRYHRAEIDLNLAIVDERRGRLDEAVAGYRRVIGLRPSDAKARTNLGLLLQRRGDFAESEFLLRSVVELAPDEPRPHLNLALLLIAQERYADAVPVLEAIVRLQPDHAGMHTTLGNVHLQLGNPAAGIPVLEKAIELDPSDAAARYSLGLAYLNAGRALEAVREFEAALDRQPDHPDAARGLEAARRLAIQPRQQSHDE